LNISKAEVPQLISAVEQLKQELNNLVLP